MIRLYIKTLLATLILLCIILCGYYFGYSYFAEKQYMHLNTQLSKGTFAYIQSILKKSPPKKWDEVVQRLQPSNKQAAKIVPLNSLILSKQQRTELLNSKIIYQPLRNHLFLNYGIDDSIALQRIGNSHYVLQIPLGEPIHQIIYSTVSWMVHIIKYTLSHTPQAYQNHILNKLQLQFGIPLKLIKKNNPIITKQMLDDLRIYGIAYQKTSRSTPISTLYFLTPHNSDILVLGPIPYSSLSQRFAGISQYYFIMFTLVSLIIVGLLTWIFSRNVRKIYYLTRQYSEGDFISKINVKPLSLLYSTFQNITAMGEKLKILVQSQQNITHFVAHEIRTPLSTMQLAVDNLHKEISTPHMKKNLESIQEDIHSINQLIQSFFIYQQGNLQKLNLKLKKINIEKWLKAIIDRYNPASINIKFDPGNYTNNHTNIDPDLLKHAIENLLTNAIKFSRKNIEINLSISTQNITITIEDDGPGIPESKFENIFQPFTTLEEEYSSGKHIGLGLAIARSIVELHKGKIFITNASTLGGAKFSVVLPCD